MSCRNDLSIWFRFRSSRSSPPRQLRQPCLKSLSFVCDVAVVCERLERSILPAVFVVSCRPAVRRRYRFTSRRDVSFVLSARWLRTVIGYRRVSGCRTRPSESRSVDVGRRRVRATTASAATAARHRGQGGNGHGKQPSDNLPLWYNHMHTHTHSHTYIIYLHASVPRYSFHCTVSKWRLEYFRNIQRSLETTSIQTCTRMADTCFQFKFSTSTRTLAGVRFTLKTRHRKPHEHRTVTTFTARVTHPL